jgi:hypothetical protein
MRFRIVTSRQVLTTCRLVFSIGVRKRAQTKKEELNLMQEQHHNNAESSRFYRVCERIISMCESTDGTASVIRSDWRNQPIPGLDVRPVRDRRERPCAPMPHRLRPLEKRRDRLALKILGRRAKRRRKDGFDPPDATMVC